MTVFPPALSTGPVADQALFGQLRLIKLQVDEKTGSEEADRKTLFCGLTLPSGLFVSLCIFPPVSHCLSALSDCALARAWAWGMGVKNVHKHLLTQRTYLRKPDEL